MQHLGDLTGEVLHLAIVDEITPKRIRQPPELAMKHQSFLARERIVHFAPRRIDERAHGRPRTALRVIQWLDGGVERHRRIANLPSPMQNVPTERGAPPLERTARAR